MASERDRILRSLSPIEREMMRDIDDRMRRQVERQEVIHSEAPVCEKRVRNSVNDATREKVVA